MTDHPSLSSASRDDRLRVIGASFSGDESVVREGLAHTDGEVRMSALVGLQRLALLTDDILSAHVDDVSADVRRTTAELSAHFPTVDIVRLLTDSDVFVAEMAAWALGERQRVTDAELRALIEASTSSNEPLVREAATASLGAIGDERALPAILRACSDKPAIRRRAVLALAPFEGDDVDEALQRALSDKDWQVRQNAEDLLLPRDGDIN